MAEPNYPLKVFLCHAHSDKDAVRDLYRRLIKDGVDAWLDKEKLLPGQDWELEICKAVREADVVVVCLSKQFNQAGFRQKEVRLALDTAMEKPEGEIFIIPARLEDCDNLESLRKWHWVDVFEEDGYEMLMRALRARADKIGTILQASIQNKDNGTQPVNTFRRINNYLRANIGAVLAVLGVWIALLSFLFGDNIIGQISGHPVFAPGSVSSPTQTKMVTVIMTPQLFTPSKTIEPSQRPAEELLTTEILGDFPTGTITPTPTLRIGSTMTGKDGMIMLYVPSGKFTMGSNYQPSPDEQASSYNDNHPQHIVDLKSFWIDQTEVTNKQYSMCVSDGGCTSPLSLKSPRRSSYYSDPQYDDYPVIYIEWDMAKDYCEWAGRRLPTEAEWEKAARGVDGRIYPWGNETPNNTLLNYNNYWGDTSVVRYYAYGKSPYGAYDMAGNVWEWTSSLYMPYPYDSTDGREDTLAKRNRVLRGGSWYYIESSPMSIFRWGVIPVEELVRSDVRSFTGKNGPNAPYGFGTVGFRCARDATP